jgi:hypothetical protein
LGSARKFAFKFKAALISKPAREGRDSASPSTRVGQIERRACKRRIGDKPALIALPPIFETKIDVAMRECPDFVD